MSDVKVHIDGIATGGAGVGKIAVAGDDSLIGLRGFVPFTIPGETITATIESRKDRFFEGSLKNITTQAASRVKPLCQYFTRCGGCDLQHIAYAEQLEFKLQMIRDGLRVGKISPQIIEKVQRIVPGMPYGYRRRISLHVNNEGEVGYYRRRTREILAISTCPISVDAINKTLFKLDPLTILLRGVEATLNIESDGEKVVAILSLAHPNSSVHSDEVMRFLSTIFSAGEFRVKGKRVSAFGDLSLSLDSKYVPGNLLLVPAGSFSQVNWGVNQALVDKVISIAEASNAKTVEDLYAGAGNFALPLAAKGFGVLAVEGDSNLVSLGIETCKLTKLKLSFLCSSVERHLATREQKNVDLVIADPPRAGLGKLTNKFGYTRNLILISCDYASFVRDLKNLIADGWRVDDIAPFDMFSQTAYVEILTTLSR